MPTHALPYRAEPTELRRFLLALARGRRPSQLRQTEFSSKTFDGVSASADALGLTNGRSGDLSPLGRRYAMASGPEAAEAAREIVLSYPPYAELVGATRESESSTALSSIQEWWASMGFGGSDSNRSEGAPVFARFVEAAGLGRFIQGRKGRASRIEWTGTGQGSEPAGVDHACGATDVVGGGSPESVSASADSGALSMHAAVEPNRVSWELAPGRRLVLELPARILPDERDRAMRLVSLLLGGG